MRPWEERVLVADGAMGTMLMERGLETGQCPEAFNLDRIDAVADIAVRYAEAGADLVSTNTFGGSAVKLKHYNLDGRTDEINAAAVRAVRGAIGDSALVNLSVGPSGAILQPFGDADPGEVGDGFRRQVAAGIDAGADFVTVETMTAIEEALLAVAAVREISATIPLAATMTFDPTPRGFFTIMGITVERAATELAEAGADLIGSNCGYGIEHMVEIAREFHQHSGLPLIIQANAGLPEHRGGSVVYPESPAFMAARVMDLASLGVRIIGGCCGTTPAHIAAIRAAVDELDTTPGDTA